MMARGAEGGIGGDHLTRAVDGARLPRGDLARTSAQAPLALVPPVRRANRCQSNTAWRGLIASPEYRLPLTKISDGAAAMRLRQKGGSLSPPFPPCASEGDRDLLLNHQAGIDSKRALS